MVRVVRASMRSYGGRVGTVRGMAYQSSSARSASVYRIGQVVFVGAAAVSYTWYTQKPAFAEAAVDYTKVKGEIEKLLDANDDIGPTLVRLAWHSSGTYDKETGTGGSDGKPHEWSNFEQVLACAATSDPKFSHL